MSPRPFERPATIALPKTEGLPEGASLEGLWLPARSDDEPLGGAVVAPPHPLMGGSMDSPVTTEIAMALSDSERVAVRFNWRGVGASAGVPSGEVGDADQDYRACLEFTEESVEGPLLAAGYSWGALAAARVGVGASRVRRLVLVAPPPGMLDSAALAASGMKMLFIAGDQDSYVPLDELRACVAEIPDASLVVLPEVDHFFMRGLAEVGRSVRDWLA
ncbi:MAG: alpha/beta hydrolase [Myxococcota bacterium]